MSAFDPEDKLEDGLNMFRKGFYLNENILYLIKFCLIFKKLNITYVIYLVFIFYYI